MQYKVGSYVILNRKGQELLTRNMNEIEPYLGLRLVERHRDYNISVVYDDRKRSYFSIPESSFDLILDPSTLWE